MLCLLPLGFYMVSLDFSPFKLDLYWWHKSFGNLVFFLVLLRLIWRFITKKPDHIETHAKWERTLAALVHVLLYAGMIGMPLSGILMSAAADFPRPFFGLFEIPDVIDGKDDDLFKTMRWMHEVFAFCLLAAVGLHGVGAFKHHFIDKDITLQRMLPQAAGKGGAALVLAVFILLLGASSLMVLKTELLHKEPQVTEPVRAQTEQAAVPELAAQNEQTEQTPDMVSPDIQQWQIVSEESEIGFEANVQGAPFKGQFMEFGGDIFFDPDHLAQSHADITVRINSVQSGSDERDEYMVMPPWLHAESFPESHLVTTKIEKIDENQYVAYANLALRDVTLPVQVPFTLTISTGDDGQKRAEMLGSFTINRLDYNVGTGDWANPETVENALTISVSINALGL